MRQVVILLSLLAIAAASTALGERTPEGVPADANTLAATGFILLAAYSFGELFRRFRLPALLGYLGAGMLFGPSMADVVLGSRAAAPITDAGLEGLVLVNMLAVGVIGTMGGGEIRIEDLRESFRKIAAITLVVFVIVLPTIAALVLGLSSFAPSLIPFLADEPLAAQLAAALLFGTLAVGMSPSATLALLLEVRAHGRFTSLVLGVVVLADLVLVATFLLTLALAKLLVSPEGFSLDLMLEVLPHIGAEFGWAILLGLIVGGAFIAYLRLVGRELLLFSLGIIFITSIVAARLHAETLLAFLVGGFVVQNFSRHGHTLIEAFERIALPVFVIYFTTQAAALDLVAVTVYLPLTLLLVVVRCTLFYVGVGSAARLARVDDEQRKLLRISFFSQGGVDLVLAAMIAAAIPGWGVEVQTVTVATILFYVVLGPPLLARALDRAGESAAARERGAEALETHRGRQQAPAHRATLAWLETGDLLLDRRLRALRRVVKEVLAEVVSDGAAVRARQRSEVIEVLSRSITLALDPEGLVREGDDAVDVPALRQRLSRVHGELARRSASWSDPARFVPLAAPTLVETFERLLDAEPLGTLHRIARDPSLFEPRGPWWQRLIRFGRRIRRVVLGPGMRTVPVGRLWRYHVALDVPVAFWSGVRPHEGEAWLGLLRHYRATRATIEALATGRRPPAGTTASPTGSHAPVPPGDGHGDHDEGAAAEPPPSPRELLSRAHAEALEREQALVTRCREQDVTLEHQLETALDDAWSAFTDSVAVAGTFEHPAWRFRVSTRYDASQAALAELRERLDRDLDAAAGVRDALATLAHAARLDERTTQRVAELSRDLSTGVEASLSRFDRLRSECRALAEPPGTRASGLLEVAGELVIELDRLTRELEDPEAPGTRDAMLTITLLEVPEQLGPMVLPTTASAEAVDQRMPIALRSWLDQAVLRELTVAVLDVRAQAAKRIASVVVALQHTRQVLDYHLGAASASGEPLDGSVGERVSALVERARAELEQVRVELEQALRDHLERIRTNGVTPLLEGRWKDVQRQHRKLDDVSRAPLTERVRERVLARVDRASRSIRQLRDELAALLVSRTTPHAMEAYRRLLFGPASTMPDAYQRLFTSAPAETIGLVLDRPEVARVEAGIERWLSGGGGPVLVRGDRGVGKRTLIRRVAGRIGDRLRLRWLSLSPELDGERDVARALAPMMGLRVANAFDELAASARRVFDIETRSTRTAIVVVNAERLFRRTPEGLHRIQRFFDLVAATSGDVLWIVLMAEPGARLLAPVLELEGRFPVIVTVPPMSTRQLQRVLSMRHALSGYPLRFRHHAPSLHEWVRHPAAAWRTRRRTGAATYERLSLLSAGNVRQALRLWLASTRLDPTTGDVEVGPIEATPDALLDELPLVSRILLAALLLHGPLRRDELSVVALRQGHALDAEITHLVHLGLVSLVVDGPGGLGERGALVQVNTRLVAPLTQELRACNLL